MISTVGAVAISPLLNTCSQNNFEISFTFWIWAFSSQISLFIWIQRYFYGVSKSFKVGHAFSSGEYPKNLIGSVSDLL